jgi:hypothetical protein
MGERRNIHDAIDDVEQERANRLFQTEATWPLPDEERWFS